MIITIFGKNRVVHSTNYKLEFFTSQKSIYSQEHYLSAIKKIKYRQALSKFRLSNHSLNIEAGRYKQPKIPREQRICLLCNLSKVETFLSVQRTCTPSKWQWKFDQSQHLESIYLNARYGRVLGKH